MKKNLITLIAAISILAAGTAFAAELPGGPVVQGDIMLTSETAVEATATPEVTVEVTTEATVEAPVSMPSYISNTVTVTEVAEGTISTVIDTESTDEINNVVNFNTDEKTLVYTANGEEKTIADVKKDDVITVFTSSYEPATLQLPASYKANVVVINSEDALNVNVDTYVKDGEVLVNAANTLALNVETAEYENKDLIVFYGASTRSIPAQTTPEKVVVIGENEVALAQIEAAKNETAATPAPEATVEPEATTAPEVTEAPVVEAIKVDNSFTTEEGTVMVPLREIAEKLGYTVGWNGETRSVTLNEGKYSLKIDENKYIAGRAMPVELGSAPVIKDDLTFVPVEYFTQVLEVAEGTIVTE